MSKRFIYLILITSIILALTNEYYVLSHESIILFCFITVVYLMITKLSNGFKDTMSQYENKIVTNIIQGIDLQIVREKVLLVIIKHIFILYSLANKLNYISKQYTVLVYRYISYKYTTIFLNKIYNKYNSIYKLNTHIHNFIY